MVPDFMNHIDMEASKVTTSILRDIIKRWKGSGLDDLPLDPQQLKTLDQTISQVSDDLSAGRQPAGSQPEAQPHLLDRRRWHRMW